MRHFFYIDPFEKLNMRKDSTLQLAHTVQLLGGEAWLIFEKDLQWSNQTRLTVKCYSFSAEWEVEGSYLQNVKLIESNYLEPRQGDIIHMRLDPPFDGRYLRYLWILDQWERRGVRVLNRPRGIMQFNEKLLAYQQQGALSSWVGEDAEGFERFLEGLKGQGTKEIILKPLDLYSGIGVEKWMIDDPRLMARMNEKARELQGPLVAQPFQEAVYEGEVRALYYDGKHLGSILKKPKSGEFLSNIAQGAAFEAYELPVEVQRRCLAICNDLSKEGVPWVAFDILGGIPTEVNITCPGLLVEVSYAHKTNLAKKILELI